MRNTRMILASWVALGAAGSAPAAVTFDWATVGDPGNAADTRVMNDSTTGYGSVNYAYQISKTDVTNGQYVEFLNAVAQSDPYQLFDANAASHYGIQRTGSDGSYVYSLQDPAWENAPVDYVTYYSALRFINWLSNGQPVGAEGSGTTEDGVYTFSSATTVSGREVGATIFLPDENEWYKAAYYKGGGPNAGYWLYATQSDTAPTNTTPANDDGNAANWNYGAYSQYNIYFSPVGAYGLSVSAYGTFDQTGNVFNWTEGGANPAIRGGSWLENNTTDISASARFPIDPLTSYYTVGFRVASISSVPEPAGLAILAMGGTAILLHRRRR